MSSRRQRITSVPEKSFGQADSLGTSKEPARRGHTHGTMDNPIDAHLSASDPHTPYLRADGGRKVTGNLDINYRQLLRASDHKDVIINIPVTGNEVESQTFFATDICTPFKFCDGSWRPMQSFDAVTLYVDSTLGTDAVGKGYASGTGAFKTWLFMLDQIPPLSGGELNIEIAGGTYGELVTIQGKAFSGPYNININGTLSQTVAQRTATGGGAYSMGAVGAGAIQAVLNDAAAAWGVNAYQNKVLELTGGTGYDATTAWKNYYIIDSNTATALTIVGPWRNGTPTGTTTYKIMDFATIIDGATTRLFCLKMAGQRNIILNKVFLKDSTATGGVGANILVDSQSSLTLRTFAVQMRNGISAVEVTSGSTIKMQTGYFSTNAAAGSMTTYLRYQAAFTPLQDINDSIDHVKFDGQSKMQNAVICAAQSFINESIYGCVMRNFTTQTVNVNSFSRADLENTIIQGGGSASSGLVRVDAGNIIIRGGCEISGGAGNGIIATNNGYVQVAASGSQVNNNTLWGALIQSGSVLTGPTSLSYTGNTSGSYVQYADASKIKIGAGTAGATHDLEIAGTFKSGGATDYFEVEAGGTVVFKGNATVWDDLLPAPISVGVGAAAPAYTSFNGNLKAYEFVGAAIMKEVNMAFQLRHGYKEGSNIIPHIHLYVPDDVTGGTIKFGCEYTWINKNGTEGATTTVYSTLVIGASAGNLGNEPLSFGEITGTGKVISSLFTCRIFRDPTDAADTFGSSVWLKSSDLHVEQDTVASRELHSK